MRFDGKVAIVTGGSAGIGEAVVDEFLKRMRSKHRYWVRRMSKLLENDYPGKVSMEKLAVLPDSTPPDFGGIQIKEIIPGWGEFFQTLENFVLQLKGILTSYH